MAFLLERIASDAVIDRAYAWLCAARKDYHHNDSVWHLRRGWREIRPQLLTLLRAGQYRFTQQEAVRGAQGMTELWHARDALVPKAIAIVLTEHRYAFRTDVQGYYASTTTTSSTPCSGGTSEIAACSAWCTNTSSASWRGHY